MGNHVPGRTSGPDAVRAAFEIQAGQCDDLGSPFTATLCRLCGTRLDHDTAVGRRVLGWPGDPVADALPLRLAGGLHALVLGQRAEALVAAYPPNVLDVERLWQAVSDALMRHEEHLVAMLERPPQTNEVARSAILLPALLTIARTTTLPLALLELGASAGLNLLWDRFHYRYGDAEWGDATSPVRLAPDLRGGMPRLDGVINIVSRRGVDVAPIDAANTDDRLRLRSYVWADQTARLARLDGALALAQALSLRVETGDAAVWLDTALADRADNVATVVFHSVMWLYLPPATQQHIASALNQAGANASATRPLAWLRFEGVSGREPATLTLTQWPAAETRVLAQADFHGRWLDWRD